MDKQNKELQVQIFEYGTLRQKKHQNPYMVVFLGGGGGMGGGLNDRPENWTVLTI